jgi:hypothetical protein
LFFAIAIAEHFEFRPDWYRQGAVAALVLEYYFVLRSVLRTKPHLRSCRTRCRQCGIFFVAHPRNAVQRHKMRCPFGCREAHRRAEAIGRSIAYYRDPRGKRKKSDLNQRRSHPGSKAPPPKPLAPQPSTCASKVRSARPRPPILEHVRMVVSLIEGRRISRRQVLRMLANNLRQHSLVRRKKIDQAVAWLLKHPP